MPIGPAPRSRSPTSRGCTRSRRNCGNVARKIGGNWIATSASPGSSPSGKRARYGVLKQFGDWLEAEAPRVLPKSPLREAMEYTRNNWTALNQYAHHGHLAIDNNAAERALRGIAIGRRNWLFLGSDRGGRAAAVHFSLIASCLRNNVEPFAYLRDLLTRLPTLLPGAHATRFASAPRPLATGQVIHQALAMPAPRSGNGFHRTLAFLTPFPA